MEIIVCFSLMMKLNFRQSIILNFIKNKTFVVVLFV